jgi:ribosomal protein L31
MPSETNGDSKIHYQPGPADILVQKMFQIYYQFEFTRTNLQILTDLGVFPVFYLPPTISKKAHPQYTGSEKSNKIKGVAYE